MKYDPDKHHRRSIRLSGYDYSQAGAYFVTLCTQDRELFFGEVDGGILQHNPAGQMIQHWWLELGTKFETIIPAEHVVMPNHFHGIVRILESHDDISSEVSVSLSQTIQWFKTMTTNAYIRGVKQHQWPPFRGKLWQRNYYEYIIRDEDIYRAVANYIIQNPVRWAMDRYNVNAIHPDPEAQKLWQLINPS